MWPGIEVAPLAAVGVPVRVLPVWLGCWGPSLALGYAVGRRLGHSTERALPRAAAVLPVGLPASFAVFVAPGGALSHNITFLERTEAVLWWTAFGLVLLATPAVLVAGLATVGRRGQPEATTYSTRSTSVAMPWPKPMHIVQTP